MHVGTLVIQVHDPHDTEYKDSVESSQSNDSDHEDEDDRDENDNEEREFGFQDPLTPSHGGTGVELEIEGDFECAQIFTPLLRRLIFALLYSRLVENIRGKEGSPGSGMLSRVWDLNMEEMDAEFRDDLREASGIGRKRRKVTFPSHHTRIWLNMCPDHFFRVVAVLVLCCQWKSGISLVTVTVLTSTIISQRRYISCKRSSESNLVQLLHGPYSHSAT
jgi:hypothetical protein